MKILETGPRVPLLYTGERHGNFSYAIPVAPGSYTVKLHFLESFFSPLIPAAHCHGVGCRVFDVTCNGVMLLQDFDIVQAALGRSSLWFANFMVCIPTDRENYCFPSRRR